MQSYTRLCDRQQSIKSVYHTLHMYLHLMFSCIVCGVIGSICLDGSENWGEERTFTERQYFLNRATFGKSNRNTILSRIHTTCSQMRHELCSGKKEGKKDFSSLSCHSLGLPCCILPGTCKRARIQFSASLTISLQLQSTSFNPVTAAAHMMGLMLKHWNCKEDK